MKSFSFVEKIKKKGVSEGNAELLGKKYVIGLNKR